MSTLRFLCLEFTRRLRADDKLKYSLYHQYVSDPWEKYGKKMTEWGGICNGIVLAKACKASTVTHLILSIEVSQ